MELTAEQRHLLIEMVHERRILWDSNSSDYKYSHSHPEKLAAWKEISLKFNATPDATAKYFSRMREYYRINLVKYKRTGVEPKWEFFCPMKFLESVIKHTNKQNFDSKVIHVKTWTTNQKQVVHSVKLSNNVVKTKPKVTNQLPAVKPLKNTSVAITDKKAFQNDETKPKRNVLSLENTLTINNNNVKTKIIQFPSIKGQDENSAANNIAEAKFKPPIYQPKKSMSAKNQENQKPTSKLMTNVKIEKNSLAAKQGEKQTTNNIQKRKISPGSQENQTVEQTTIQAKLEESSPPSKRMCNNIEEILSTSIQHQSLNEEPKIIFERAQFHLSFGSVMVNKLNTLDVDNANALMNEIFLSMLKY